MVSISKLRKADELNKRLLSVIKPEEFEKLAKNGLCPHYRLYNPLTGDESYWFVLTEINDWFETNYIKLIKGHRNMEIKFLDFSLPVNPLTIPHELSTIKGLMELPISAICNIPGIYFLYLGDKLQYIGQSVNIIQRVSTHIRDQQKEFDRAYFMICDEENLDHLEGTLVRKLKPPLTKSSPVPRVNGSQVIYQNQKL